MDERPPFTEETLAEYLSVPRKTLGHWRGQGAGPRWYRAGRYVRYRPEDVREWEAAQVDETAPARTGT